jgi:hypothetical protein
MNVAFYPIYWVERHIRGNVKRVPRPFELSTLADLAGFVPTQRIDDKLARIARQVARH